MGRLNKQALLAAAKEYLSYGLSVLALQGEDGDKPKNPSSGLLWKPYQSNRPTLAQLTGDFSRPDAGWIGVITGKVSGSPELGALEVLDVDCKHDLTGTLWDDLSGLLKDNLPAIYPSLVIARTTSGGYHVYYRCSTISGNEKLARRPATEAELDEAFIKAREKAVLDGRDPEKVRREKVREIPDLVETRGEGGYVVAPPSTGYSFIQGSLADIPTISPEERDMILAIGRSFNLISEEEPEPPRTYANSYQASGLSPFAAFNQSPHAPDVILGLLEERGWTHWRQGPRIFVKRPGHTTSSQSGNLHLELNRLHVFSSSSELDPGSYSMSDVYIELECNGDKALAARRLREMGYGDEPARPGRPTQVATERIKVSLVNRVNKETRVIAEPGGRLKVETLKGSSESEVVIDAPEGTQPEEVLKAVQLAVREGMKVYVVDAGEEKREYRYYLDALFAKYRGLQEESGLLTDRQLHDMLEDVVMFGHELRPVDRDVYVRLFLSQDAIKELGVTQASLDDAIKRLQARADRERQEKAVDKLLGDVETLRTQGKTKDALDVLQERLPDVKGMDRTQEYLRLSVPKSQQTLIAGLKDHPAALETGYKLTDEDVLIPTGAITTLTGATSHGKTTFLINLLLRLAHRYPKKEFYLFSYEEDAHSILINTLNTYVGVALSGNARRNLKDYFRRGKEWNRKYIYDHMLGHPQHLKTAEEGIERFFRELYDTGRIHIHYVEYDSDELIGAIRHLKKNANPGGILVDYMQMLRAPSGKFKTYSRQEELKAICRELKDTAVDTTLPIVMAAQQNRTTTSPLQLHPTRIGEAGDIERISNMILGFWNWNLPCTGLTEEQKKEVESIKAPGKLYVRMLKNRAGNMSESFYENWDYDGNLGLIGKPGWNGPADAPREEWGNAGGGIWTPGMAEPF
jgi:hypothetical protein